MNIKIKHAGTEIPEYMRTLPVTEKGYLKPWFVKADDFRIVDSDKAMLSINKERCWICGQAFKPAEYALVGGPECAKSRAFTEPPCHVECAEYAVQVCPFLLYPGAKRREAGLAPEATLAHRNASSAVPIKGENPGEHYIFVVKDFSFSKRFHVMQFTKDKVIEIQFWRDGVRQTALPDSP